MEVFIGFEKKPLLFTAPVELIRCHDPASFARSFAAIERALGNGLYAAGFLSYESGYCFEPSLRPKGRRDFPLLLMGIYKKPAVLPFPGRVRGGFSLSGFRLNISRREYGSRIGLIREHIARGDVYQITYCVKFRFNFRGDDKALYARLLRSQPVPYPAYIRADSFSILSLSPERFVTKEAGRVITEPMKGTWPRGSDAVSDRAARRRFRRDVKNRAENLMIADLLRNDLGRIGRDIRWPKIFSVSAYKTLYQMTSTVTAEVCPDIPLYDLFAALFPSGSVTGAPKIRAMEIIRGIESEERRIYTGAIGYISPSRDMYFNVPIRTILLRNGEGEMGVGGGIIWDSTPQGEWEEGMLKARFLTGLDAAHGQALPLRLG